MLVKAVLILLLESFVEGVKRSSERLFWFRGGVGVDSRLSVRLGEAL